ncbi:BolA family protein [Aliidiomarina quisquiliarum]|uniref:BolA family protein n=1 Tax=Aliidiomarina quisquiliarum TaxID=2938947 RepID=UPI00208E0AE1|nr:BolA family protein [Aliidiomarina quisquiliarum]MCO4321436.1 BolA family transcriptional regulator [Aliidiomarina quisquiliarum]
MEPSDIEELLTKELGLEEVHVKAEGTHYQVIAVSEEIAQLSRVKQQQMIYAPLNDKIADGTIHALSIKVFTPERWRREKLLNMPG